MMFMRFFCLVAIVLVLAMALQEQAKAQVIVTGAWGRARGQFAYAVDGDLSGPSCFTVDTLGYLYVADDKNHRIQQFTPAGTYVTAYTVPRGEGVDGIAVSLDLTPDGRSVKSRTIYTARFVGYGFKQEHLLVSRVENGIVRPFRLPVPPLMIYNIATDSHHRLFVLTKGDKDPLSSVWLFDGDLRYRGHRDIASLCVQPGSDNLVGVAGSRPVDGQPGTYRWTIQFYSPVDMQYPLVKAVEIDVPVTQTDPARLLAVDRDGNLYVLARIGKTAAGNQWQILRYHADGTRNGTLDLTPYWRDSLHVNEVRIGPDGVVYVATGSKEGYTIRRLIWPATAAITATH